MKNNQPIGKLGYSVLASEVMLKAAFFGFMSIAMAQLLKLGLSESSSAVVIFISRIILYISCISFPVFIRRIQAVNFITTCILLIIISQIAMLAYHKSTLALACGIILSTACHGLIKPLMQVLGVTQVHNDNRTQSKMVAMLFMATNIGALAAESSMSTIYLKYGPTKVYSGTVIIATIALLIMLRHVKQYKMPEWDDKILVNLYNAMKQIMARKKDNSADSSQVNQLKRILPILMLNIPLYAVYDHMYSVMIIHTGRTDLIVLGHTVLPSQLQLINSLMIIFLTRPLIHLLKNCTLFNRYRIGLLSIVIAFLSVAAIEHLISSPLKVNCLWDLIPYALLTLGEIFTYTAESEMVLVHLKPELKSIGMGLISFGAIFGNILGMIMVSLAPNTGAAYFAFLSCMTLGIILVSYKLLRQDIN